MHDSWLDFVCVCVHVLYCVRALYCVHMSVCYVASMLCSFVVIQPPSYMTDQMGMMMTTMMIPTPRLMMNSQILLVSGCPLLFPTPLPLLPSPPLPLSPPFSPFILSPSFLTACSLSLCYHMYICTHAHTHILQGEMANQQFPTDQRILFSQPLQLYLQLCVS